MSGVAEIYVSVSGPLTRKQLNPKPGEEGFLRRGSFEVPLKCSVKAFLSHGGMRVKAVDGGTTPSSRLLGADFLEILYILIRGVSRLQQIDSFGVALPC